jgi:hypothetical protein
MFACGADGAAGQFAASIMACGPALGASELVGCDAGGGVTGVGAAVAGGDAGEG